MPEGTHSIDDVLGHVDAHLEESLSRLSALVGIKSISTDPAFAAECRRAAEWLAEDLSALGFSAEARATDGHPVVVGHQGGTAERSVLFYGHYDVQPVDPLDLWNTDPFEMTRTGEGEHVQLVGRGTSDDKGQVLTFLEACRAYKAVTGTLPVSVTMMLEGEEESGGAHLPGFMREAAGELKADLALVCDTQMWDADTPSITTSLRGMVAEEITVTCADRDLHSGGYGNAARNPIQVLADILARLRRPDGGVALPGFYDGVADVPPEVAASWETLGFDPDAFLGEIGLRFAAGEQGRSVLEQLWARPTCEINGITGGYTGDGFKTVIPSQARAKVSFRLVGGQDPDRIRESFRAHVRTLLPPDCTVEFTGHASSPAMSVPTDSPEVTAALEALTAEWARQAVVIGAGGSIPVVSDIKGILGMDTLLVGFALSDDRIHSPNEKYDLKSFHKGIRSWVRILAALAE